MTIFITAPIPELERRLRERASESEGEIGERIGLARKQLAQADEFDYVVAQRRRSSAPRRSWRKSSSESWLRPVP